MSTPLVIGIDEAGRGCWAGPLVAAAVILRSPIEGLADSKRLSVLKREQLAEVIKQEAVAWGLGWAQASEIDEKGLTAATTLAMSRAIADFPRTYTEIIIDGNYNYLSRYPRVRVVIDADALLPVVSAASILAKVARDEHMRRIADRYPMYGFDRHVGYGTRAHRQSLEKYGPCQIHRMSYRPLRELQALHDWQLKHRIVQ